MATAQYASLHAPSPNEYIDPLASPPPPPGAGLYSARSESPGSSYKEISSTHGLYLPDPSKTQYTKASAGKGFFARRKVLVAAAAILFIALAVAIPVGVVVSHNNSKSKNLASSSGDSSGNGNGSGDTSSSSALQWGGDGSTITLEDGTNVTYTNSFGGTWCSVPFNDTARPQSFTPALNEEWDYASQRIYGVNIGGWLLPEPFIASYLFEPFVNSTPQAVDEYTLSQALGTNLASTLENHYKTFITEQDFIEIAAAGLGWIRLPFGYWAIETWSGEPFLEGVSWQYALKAFKWARKYGIRINLDLHAVPGSQNGLNHSGKMGSINFLAGVMGIANAQRTLNYIRSVANFIAQPEYENVIPFFNVLNEPEIGNIGMTQMKEFYIQAYNIIRDTTGTGSGRGPYMVFHDGFQGQAQFYGFLAGADRLVIDSHMYLAFNTPPSNIPINTAMTLPCSAWANQFNTSQTSFGVSLGAEWSLALNDCGLYINSIQVGSNYETEYGAAACETFTDWTAYTDQDKQQLTQLALAYMDSFHHNFFWTWKIANSTSSSITPNPAWHYRLGWKEGFMPSDPRDSVGACASLAAEYNSPSASANIATFNGYSAWMTGAASSVSADSQSFTEWPPTSLASATGDVALYPTLTATGSPIILPTSNEVNAEGSTVTPSTMTYTPREPVTEVNWLTSVNGCSYQDPWVGTAGTVPAAACTGAAAAKRDVNEALITPAPSSL